MIRLERRAAKIVRSPVGVMARIGDRAAMAIACALALIPVLSFAESDDRKTAPFSGVAGSLVTGRPGLVPTSGRVAVAWSPASEADLRNLAFAAGVAIEHVAIADDLIAQYLAADDALSAKYVPLIQSLAGPAAAISGHELPGSEYSAREASHLFGEALASFLKQRIELEDSTVDRLMELISLMSKNTAPELDLVKQRYLDSRWRQRCAEASDLVPSARVDLVFLAREVSGPEWDSHLDDTQLQAIEAYWRETTDPSRKAIEARIRCAEAIQDLFLQLHETQADKQGPIVAERRGLCLKMHGPVFERAKVNQEWRPRIEAMVPESRREDFRLAAKRLMFPRQWGVVSESLDRGDLAIESALKLTGLGEDQSRALNALRSEVGRQRAEIDSKIESLEVETARVACNIGAPGVMMGPIAERQDRELERRNLLQAQAIEAVRNILTEEQFRAIKVIPPPLGADEEVVISPGPDGSPTEQRQKKSEPAPR